MFIDFIDILKWVSTGLQHATQHIGNMASSLPTPSFCASLEEQQRQVDQELAQHEVSGWPMATVIVSPMDYLWITHGLFDIIIQYSSWIIQKIFWFPLLLTRSPNYLWWLQVMLHAHVMPFQLSSQGNQVVTVSYCITFPSGAARLLCESCAWMRLFPSVTAGVSCT